MESKIPLKDLYDGFVALANAARTATSRVAESLEHEEDEELPSMPFDTDSAEAERHGR